MLRCKCCHAWMEYTRTEQVSGVHPSGENALYNLEHRADQAVLRYIDQPYRPGTSDLLYATSFRHLPTYSGNQAWTKRGGNQGAAFESCSACFQDAAVNQFSRTTRKFDKIAPPPGYYWMKAYDHWRVQIRFYGSSRILSRTELGTHPLLPR